VKHRRTAAAGVRRVEGIQHLEVSESCRKECVQEFSLRLRVVRKLRKDRPSNSAEELCREVVIGSS
jgi:hypothetical protein